jgi:peptide/nickel transport system permease protein
LVLARYLAMLTVTALVAGLITTCMARFSPGFGVDERELDPRLSEAGIQALRVEASAGRNPVRLFVVQLSGLLHGDLGFSRSFRRPVSELIPERIGVTARLLAAGLTGGWALALSLALLLAALKKPTLSNSGALLSTLLLCVPTSMLALAAFVHTAPFHLVIALALFPKIFQYTYGVLRQAASLPYVTAAQARGVSPARILLRHVATASAPQILALAGVSVGMAFAAAIPVEVLCDLPGIGQLAWSAALSRDLPLLVALVFLVVFLNQIANLVSDLAISVVARRSA